MFDTIVLLDDPSPVACPAGHRIRSLRTNELNEPSMNTYLVRGGRLYLAARSHADDDEEGAPWRVDRDEAIQELRYPLTELVGPRRVRAYASCRECEPILVRTSSLTWHGDLVSAHHIFVDFVLVFGTGEPLRVERTTGTRDEFKADLRAHGLYVLADNDPLAVAHRQAEQAQRRQRELTSFGRARRG